MGGTVREGRGIKMHASKVLAIAIFAGAALTGGAMLTATARAAADSQAAVSGTQSPPRSISDITAILDQERPDPVKAAQLREAADAVPPPGTSGADLVEFLYRRAGAAGEMGRLSQQLADLRQAMGLADVHGGPILSIARDLTSAEQVAGNLRSSLEAARKRWELTKDDRGARRAGALSILIRAEIAAGHIDEAARNLEQLRDIANNVPPRMPTDTRIAIGGFVADAESRFFELTGKREKAEEAIRRAIEGAQKQLETSTDAGARRTTETRLNGLMRQRSALLQHLGRYVEAEVLVRDVLLRDLRRNGKYSPATARSVAGLQKTILAQGRFAEAEKLGRAVEEILAGIGMAPNSIVLLTSRVFRAKSLAAEGKWTEAQAIIDQVEADIGGDQALHDVTLGDALESIQIRYRNGRTEAGLEAATRIYQLRLTRLGDKSYLTAEALGYRAMGLFEIGRHREALAAFRAAIPILIANSRQVDIDDDAVASARDLRRKAIFDSYVALLAWIHRNGPGEAGFDVAGEAFLVADAARGGAVQRAVAQSSARAAARDPDLAALVRDEQDMLRDIGALYGLLTTQLAVPADQRDEGVAVSLRKQIDSVRTERATIREKLERRFPDYVRLIDPLPARLGQVREALNDGEALVTTYVTDSATFIWAFGKAGEVAFAGAPLGREKLEVSVTQLRRALDPNAATLEDVPDFDLVLANHLYQALLEPVSAAWKAKNNLIVVSDGPLGQLPFSVLPTAAIRLGADSSLPFDRYRQVPWLARTHSVTVMPTVTTLIALRALQAPAQPPRAFIGFGDPIFSDEQLVSSDNLLAMRGGRKDKGRPIVLRSLPKMEGVDSAELGFLPRLPDTAEEIRSMARAAKADMSRDLFIGRAANESAVADAKLSEYRVVAFATHGLIPGDLNGLTEPALALTAPHIAGATGKGDGLLTMGEIFELKLNADWVVLSACNTGTGSGAGAEAVSGLGRAFFYAGTRALLVSNWPVETTSARALTTRVFERQAAEPSLSRAEALQQASIELIDGQGYVDPGTAKPVFSYAHPIFWAPFTVVGDGGGRQ